MTTVLHRSRRDERFRALVENATDIIYWTDEGGRLTFVNPTTSRLLGRAEAHLVGTHFTELVEPTHRAAVRLFYRRQRRERQVHTYYEFPVQTAAGAVLWLGQNVRTLFDAAGVVVGFEAMARDITERRGLERERDHLVAELKEALATTRGLRGLLPICASCKMVRDDQGGWTPIECFIRERTHAEFTHGICPECLVRYNREIDGA